MTTTTNAAPKRAVPDLPIDALLAWGSERGLFSPATLGYWRTAPLAALREFLGTATAVPSRAVRPASRAGSRPTVRFEELPRATLHALALADRAAFDALHADWLRRGAPARKETA